MPTHDFTGTGTHNCFLSLALLSAMALDAVPPMLQISFKATAKRK